MFVSPLIVPGVPRAAMLTVYVFGILEPQELLAVTLIKPEEAPHAKSTVIDVVPCPDAIVPNEAGNVQV